MTARGAEARLRGHVRAMRRVDGAVRLLESAAVALAAGGACLAAARLAGSAAGEPHAWAAGSLAAACAALAWSLEHRSGVARVVRRLDRAEGLGGALVTAWEGASPAQSSEVASLLARRTSERLEPRAGLRAMLPRSGLLFAAPLAAIALLSLADRRAGARAAALELARLEARFAALDAAVADRPAPEALLTALGRARDDLRASAADPAARAALDRRLAELAREVDGGDPNAGGPDEGAPREAVPGPHAADPAPDEASPAPGTASRTAPGSPAAPGAPAGGPEHASAGVRTGGAGEIPLVSDVEAARGDGTIPGRGVTSGASPAPAGSSTEPPAAGLGAIREGGVGQGRWWPARHDPVVARWVELGGTRDREPEPAPRPSPPPRD